MQQVKSTRGSKVYFTWLVKESYRTPAGPRSRTVCNITRLPPELREIIRLALKGHSFVSEEELELFDALDFGGLAVLRQAAANLGLDQALAGIADRRARNLIKAMIFSRILHPSSKLALKDRAQGTALAAACDLPQDEPFEENDLYAAMDALNGQWVGVEKSLYHAQYPETNPAVSLVLYDLTSVYFEGKGPKHIARYGYSRDHRTDRPQVLLAVATDGQGVPLHLEVLRGNRGDNSTLLGLLATLRRRFGLTEAVFSFDGGMSSRFNLEEMEEAELQYVTRQSDATLQALVKELPEDNQPELWDRTKLMDLEIDGSRYVIAGSPWRAERDGERRQARIDKGRAELQRVAKVVAKRKKKPDPQKLASQIGRSLQRLKAHKYYSYRLDEEGRVVWELKTDVVEAEAATDGFYLLTTNLASQEHPAEKIHGHYKNLMAVEDAFRELKTYLRVRPVYHYKPDRVRNHIRICFMAYWLSARLAAQWKALGHSQEVDLTLRALQKIRVGTLGLGSGKLGTLLTQVPKNLQAILDQLKLNKLFGSPPKWICSS